MAQDIVSICLALTVRMERLKMKCNKCDGSGFVLIGEENGLRFKEPCECFKPTQPLWAEKEPIPVVDIDYEVLFNPSKRHKANALTKFGAIDVCYKCPKCETERVITWMFPDTEFTIVDECCDIPVRFLPKEEE